MKKLEDKIRERLENCHGVTKVRFFNTLTVEVYLKPGSFKRAHEGLMEAQEQIRKKYPGILIEFSYMVDNIKKGEGL